MRNALVGFALALALYFAYHLYLWKQLSDERGWKAEVAYGWLAQQLATDATNKPLTRAAVLDAIAKGALTQSNGNTTQPSGKSSPPAR